MTTDGAAPSRIPALLAVVATAVLWGTTGTAATFAEGVGPLAIGAFSLGIGGLLQAAIAVPALREHRQLLRDNWKLVLLGGVAVFTYPWRSTAPCMSPASPSERSSRCPPPRWQPG